MRKNLILSAALITLAILNSFSQVLIKSASATYTQNFNALKLTGTSNSLPAGWKLHETGTNANTTYAANSGSSNAGNTYSYGKENASDRALGTLLSSSLIPVIGVQFKNITGKTLTSLTVSYTGEQWRCGTAGRPDKLEFQYSTDATSLTSGNWIDVSTLDFSSPSTTTTGAKDGNAASNRKVKSTNIGKLSIPDNATFWLRWVDFDATGYNDGLAIDDFTLTVGIAD